MKVCAPTCIILFPYQSMCSRAYVSIWKYVLTYILCLIMEVCALCMVCLIMEVCSLCIVCFLIAMKGIHINMQTGVCQRFSCQNGGSGVSQFIFNSIAVTYLVCCFRLRVNNVLWLTAVRHKSNSLIVRSEYVLSPMAHAPCLHTFECDVKVRVK